MLLCAIQLIENKNEPLRNSNIVGIIHVFNIYVRYDKTTCFLHVDMMFSLNKATILKITKHVRKKEITNPTTQTHLHKKNCAKSRIHQLNVIPFKWTTPPRK